MAALCGCIFGTCCPMSYDLPNIDKRLTQPGFSETDEVIFEYEFYNEKSWKTSVEYKDKMRRAALCTALAPLHVIAIPVSIICMPCCIAGQRATSKTVPHNEMERLWNRRLAVTRNGVVYRTFQQNKMGANPANPCATCLGMIDTYDFLVSPGSVKTIPYEKIQDVRIVEVTGSHQVVYCCCGADLITKVDNMVQIDTAGSGIELTLHGIEAAEHLKSAVFALKNGRELPALTNGVSSGSVQSAGARSHQIAMRAGKSNASGSNSAPTAPPVSVQMSRMEPKLAAGGFEALQRELQREHSELMQAMNEQTALLSRIADARA